MIMTILNMNMEKIAKLRALITLVAATEEMVIHMDIVMEGENIPMQMEVEMDMLMQMKVEMDMNTMSISMHTLLISIVTV